MKSMHAVVALIAGTACFLGGYRLRDVQATKQEEQAQRERALENLRTATEDWERRKDELNRGMAAAVSEARDKERTEQLDRIERDVSSLRFKQFEK